MANTTIPDNLKLLVEHYESVRELERYLHKKGVDKDLQVYRRDVIAPNLERRIPTLTEWESDIDDYGNEWFPQDWKLPGADMYLSLYVIIPNPADLSLDAEDSNPSVNLWVPTVTEWVGYTVFRERSRSWRATLRKAGFGHIDDNTGWDDEFVLGNSVKWLKSDRSFEQDDLTERIVAATKAVVDLAPAITETLREISLQCPPMEHNAK